MHDPHVHSVAHVLGRVHRGRVITDLPLETAANSHSGQTVSGTVGAGGAQVQVEVEEGNLHLKGV